MSIEQLLAESTALLAGAGIATARLDSLVIISDVLGKDKSWVLANLDYALQAQPLQSIKGQIKRRAAHEPLAYIRGKTEFYGREFIVNSHTLEPRPETETLIELLLDQVKSKKLKAENIIDVGTGSGCIAITAKLELPQALVLATDIDKKCIETATKNTLKLGADVALFQGNLLEPLPSTFDFRRSVVVANLPYVPDTYQINEAAQHEPRHAIYGGKDGLDLYREVFAHMNSLNIKPMVVITESLPFQLSTLTQIADTANYQLKTTEDFIQVFKIS